MNKMFNELVKLASEKRAYGYGMNPYGFGYYGGGRRGVGGMMSYERRTPYGYTRAGVDPSMRPQAQRMMSAQATGMETANQAQKAQIMGLAGESADAAQQRSLLGANEAYKGDDYTTKITTEHEAWEKAMAEKEKYEKELAGYQTEPDTWADKLRAQKDKMDKAKAELNSRGFAGTAWAGLAGDTAGAAYQSESDAYFNLKSDQMRAQKAQEQRRQQAEANKADAVRRAEQYRRTINERSDYTFGQQGARNLQNEKERQQQREIAQRNAETMRHDQAAQLGGAGTAAAPAAPAVPKTELPALPKPVAPAPPHPLPSTIPPPTPRPAPPPVAPGRPASAFMPPTTMDALVTGAARHMHSKYVKLANAQLHSLMKYASAGDDRLGKIVGIGRPLGAPAKTAAARALAAMSL